MTGRFDWSADVNLPVSGLVPEARHGSATGAQVAARTRGALAVAYLDLLAVSGPLSDPEAASALGRALASICSTRNGLGVLVVASGTFEETPWGTKRCRWRRATPAEMEAGS